jgi:hypothetical protein
MNNPIILFYAKVYQYFEYAGIKVINLHAQASFILAVTLFYYLNLVLDLAGLPLGTSAKISVLLFYPAVHISAYLYFNQKSMSNKLKALFQKEDQHAKMISSVLTMVLILPMLMYFTKVAIAQ